jgi:hypothetical protein
LRVDPREIYLKRLLALDVKTSSDMLAWFNIVYLIVGASASKERVASLINDFSRPYADERGPLPMHWILMNMDLARANNKRELRIKTRFVKRSFKLMEMELRLARLREDVEVVVREESRNVRITNPDIAI